MLISPPRTRPNATLPRSALDVIAGDIRDSDCLAEVENRKAISHVVHGAAMTPTVGTTEKIQAAMIVGANIMGTVHSLELARTLLNLKRLVHVSTGSIYGDNGPEGAPLPEEDYVQPFPTTLYPITKLSGGLVAGCYRELFDLPVRIVRLSGVCGPMDRWTPGRDFACALNIMVHKALAGETWTVSGAQGVGDWIHGGDVASAVCNLLAAPSPRHDIYNVTYGSAITLADLSDLVIDVVGSGRCRQSGAAQRRLGHLWTYHV